jgi:hypothetical protein
MRGLMPCILAGIAAVVAMDILAPPLALGLATVAQSATDPNQQIVDRTRKGDRLQIPKANGRRIPPAGSSLPIGCEGAFSALSAGAKANFPGRRLAEGARSRSSIG